MQSNPFFRPGTDPPGVRRQDFLISMLIHGGILILMVITGILVGERASVPMGGGEFVSVEMVVLDEGLTQSEQTEQVEEVTEVIEEQVEEVTEQVEEVTEVIEEQVEEVTEQVEEVVEQTEQTETVQEETSPASQDFIGVGSQGEAGSGAPGPASYEGRVFGAIRRNFRTSVNPPQSYRMVYTVNLDGSTSYEVVRTSGDSGFDRAVTHAVTSASIPPVPPGRTEPVQLSIEFFGPGTE